MTCTAYVMYRHVVGCGILYSIHNFVCVSLMHYCMHVMCLNIHICSMLLLLYGVCNAGVCVHDAHVKMRPGRYWEYCVMWYI